MSVWDWSQTAGTNASADASINWAEGQLPSTVNNSARAMMAALAAFIADTGGVTTAGSSNAYTLTLSQTMASATKGIITFVADRANTGAATMNVDGLGAYPLRFISGTALSSGDIVSGGVYMMTWASGSSEWLIINGALNSVAAPTTVFANAGEAFSPGGRLTLTTAVPILTSTVSGATTVYYTPYLHDMIPIWDGTNFVPKRFTELSQTTTDNTKSPAAVTTSSNYDVFVWSDSGTLRATRGPAWSSGTSRGTGAGTTELDTVRGVKVNKVAITNGPGAGYGTYVGTIRSNGSSQIDFILGGSASGGTESVLNVWNYYNRAKVRAEVTDSGTSYTYTTATIRSMRASATNRVSFVSGLAEDCIDVNLRIGCTTVASAGAGMYFGIGLDTTTAFTYLTTLAFSQAASALSFYDMNTSMLAPQIGSHYIQALELGDGVNANTVATTTLATILQAGIMM